MKFTVSSANIVIGGRSIICIEMIVLLSPASPKAWDGRYCLSICPSVTFSFRTVTQKRMDVFSRNFAGMCTMSGACCIVFDIDGMFDFFMNFLNIEKNKKFRFCLQYFMFSLRFMLFATKFRGGGGGGGVRKTILSHFTFYVIFNIKKILKSFPSLTG